MDNMVVIIGAVTVFSLGGIALACMIAMFRHNVKTQEKRRCHRVNMTLPVMYQILDTEITAKLIDISATGVCMESITKFKKEDKLHITITLPNDKTVHLKTEVKWITAIGEKFKVGLQIIPSGTVSEGMYIQFCAKEMWK